MVMPAAKMSVRRAGPPVPSPGMNDIDAIRAGIIGDASADELGSLPLPASYRGAVVRADEQEMFEGLDSADKDPRKSLHIDDVADAGAGARRGGRGGDGVVDQLQHGVDVDLRAAPDVRVPPAPRQGERVGRRATTSRSTWSAATPRAWCCASARPCGCGSRATRSPCTATTSTTRTRRHTTTRCSPPTSASGATRPTSAAWASSPW